MLKRNKQIHIYLDEGELQRFKNRVGKSGLTQNAYVRHLLNDRIPQDRPPPEYYGTLKEIRAIGSNINQMATVAHVTGMIDAEKFDERYETLCRLILQLIYAAEMPREVK